MMPAETPPDLYDVHLFAVVRVKVPNVQAASPREAIDRARDQALDLYERFEATDGEFTEEFSQFLVDVVGDDGYDLSQWFYSTDDPLLRILESLVASHHSNPRDAARIEQIVREAKQALQVTA